MKTPPTTTIVAHKTPATIAITTFDPLSPSSFELEPVAAPADTYTHTHKEKDTLLHFKFMSVTSIHQIIISSFSFGRKHSKSKVNITHRSRAWHNRGRQK